MFSKTKFVSTLKCIFLRRYGIYKVGLIENIYFAYRLYGYIHAWIRIYFRSFISFRIHGARQVLPAVFSWLFLSGKMYIFRVQFWVQSRVQSMFCTMPEWVYLRHAYPPWYILNILSFYSRSSLAEHGSIRKASQVATLGESRKSLAFEIKHR